MIREPRERGVEGQMREAARIDNFVAMDVSVPFRAQDIFPGLGWANTPIRIRVFSCKQNKRAGGWSWWFHAATTQFQKLHAEIRSFLPQPHPLSTPPTHPPSTSAPSAPPFGGACRKTGSTGSMFRCAGHSERGQWIHLAVDDYPLRIGVQPTVHSSRRNVCIYRSEGARSPMKAFRGGGFRLEASNRSVSIHRRWYIYIYIYRRVCA